jgi:hypothetical protein
MVRHEQEKVTQNLEIASRSKHFLKELHKGQKTVIGWGRSVTGWRKAPVFQT